MTPLLHMSKNIKIFPRENPVNLDNKQDYAEYPEKEDIYNIFKESDLDPEDIANYKKMIPYDDTVKDLDEEFTNDVSGRNLDIPGSELDDDQEDTGNEDEENNYYSLGGDNHNDLDEDHDDL